MDIEIGVKVEDPLSDDISSENAREFCTKVATMKTNSDFDLLDDDDCDMVIKTEINSERECFTKHPIMQIQSEGFTFITNCKINMKTEIEEQTAVAEFGSQNEREFLENPVIKVKEYKNNHEIDKKIEIKEEPWWLETEASFVCDDIKDVDFSPVKCSRLSTKDIFGDSSDKAPLASTDILEREISFYSEKDHPEYENKESNVIEIPNVEQHCHSKQINKCSDGDEIHSRSLYFKQNNLIQKDERPHKCTICGNRFTQFSALKRHNLIHEGRKPQQCKTCNKSFARLSDLKIHNLIHEGKKPHHCDTCNKNFTQLSTLKRHFLIHEGNKPHQCKICDKSFTLWSNLKMHNLIHEGKKPHHCKSCDKSFTELSNLKRHNLIHDGKKPYQCKTCNKSFTRLSGLKMHNLIHEGKKPHQCETCDKNFARLSDLKRHNFIHEGNKPHQCKNCDKSFTQKSYYKIHNLIHEGKKPYQCNTCDKNFTQLSSLKRHKLIHQSLTVT